MKVGDRYSSPWGEYTVRALEPQLVLVAGVAAIVGPSADTLAQLKLCDRNGEMATPTRGRRAQRSPRSLIPTAVGGGVAGSTPADHTGSGGLPVAFDPKTETGNRTEITHSAAGGDAPAGTSVKTVVDTWLRELPMIDDALLDAHPKTLGAYRNAMAAVTRPDADTYVWTSCPTRYRDEATGTSSSHVVFRGKMSAVWCYACRLERPRFLIKDRGVIVHDSHADDLDFAGDDVGHVVLSPDEMRPRSDGAGVESSTSDLLAGTAAREEDVPPAPSDAHPTHAHPGGSGPSTILPADDPKDTVADFARVVHPTPIARAWLGLWEWKEWCAERAAIIEYDANWPRGHAERRARDLAGSAPR